MKNLFFDSSALISMSLTCQLRALEKLSEDFAGKFYITSTIKKETIEKALKTPRFQLEGLRLKNLLDKGVLNIYSDKDLKADISLLAKKINSTFYTRKRPVALVHPGEMSTLVAAFVDKSPTVIDERTARLLIEAPQELQKLMEMKLHTRVRYDKDSLRELQDLFSSMEVLRSSELILSAVQKGYMGPVNKGLLEASLYALMFNGCAISTAEIKDYLRFF